MSDQRLCRALAGASGAVSRESAAARGFVRMGIGVGWVVPSRVVALVVALAAAVTVGGIAATPAWAGPLFHIYVYNKTNDADVNLIGREICLLLVQPGARSPA
jgi:hypothetical protein